MLCISVLVLDGVLNTESSQIPFSKIISTYFSIDFEVASVDPVLRVYRVLEFLWVKGLICKINSSDTQDSKVVHCITEVVDRVMAKNNSWTFNFLKTH